MDFGSAEEISVDTAAMGAEIGGGGGANINVVPKSGGNEVRGEALYNTTGRGVWQNFSGNYSTVENISAFPIPFDSNLRNYTTSAKYQITRNNQFSAFWTYNRKFQPH